MTINCTHSDSVLYLNKIKCVGTIHKKAYLENICRQGVTKTEKYLNFMLKKSKCKWDDFVLYSLHALSIFQSNSPYRCLYTLTGWIFLLFPPCYKKIKKYIPWVQANWISFFSIQSLLNLEKATIFVSFVRHRNS